MIVVAGALPQRHRDLIIAVTARTKLPTVYSNDHLSRLAASLPMERMKPTSIAARRAMSIASSEVRNPPTFRYRLRQNTSWS